MYEGVRSCVFTGNMKSNYFTSNAGVRQGENLSSLLFSLYINDLEEYLLAKVTTSLISKMRFAITI